MADELSSTVGIVALAAAAVAAFWAYGKAFGAEYDYCPRGGASCVSGWYGVALLASVAAVAAVSAVVLLRRKRPTRPGRGPSGS